MPEVVALTLAESDDTTFPFIDLTTILYVVPLANPPTVIDVLLLYAITRLFVMAKYPVTVVAGAVTLITTAVKFVLDTVGAVGGSGVAYEDTNELPNTDHLLVPTFQPATEFTICIYDESNVFLKFPPAYNTWLPASRAIEFTLPSNPFRDDEPNTDQVWVTAFHAAM